MKKSVTEKLRAEIAKAEKRGQTRYAIAKAAGLALPVLIRIADGKATPRLDIAERVAKAIDLQLTLVTN